MKLQLRFTALTLYLNRNFRWVVLGTAIIILGVGVVTLIAPKWSQVSEQGLLTLDRERTLTDTRQAYLIQLKQSLDAYHAFTDNQVALLERVLPSGFDVGPLFVEMSDLFSAAGYELSEISVATKGATQASVTAASTVSSNDPTVQKLNEQAQKNSEAVFLNKNLRSIQLTLNLTGSQNYSDIKRLLTAIEAHQRIMDVRSVSFNISDETVPAEDVTAGTSVVLSADMYYFQSL